MAVRPCGRRAERRVKRTSVGVWMRDCVRVKMFSGLKRGRVFSRKMADATKRIVRARTTCEGTGRMDIPWMEGEARIDL